MNRPDEWFNACVEVLLPHLPDAAHRKAALQEAFHGIPRLTGLDCEGNAHDALVRILGELARYGKLANGMWPVNVFLEAVKKGVGTNVQHQLTQLQRDYDRLMARPLVSVAVVEPTDERGPVARPTAPHPPAAFVIRVKQLLSLHDRAGGAKRQGLKAAGLFVLLMVLGYFLGAILLMSVGGRTHPSGGGGNSDVYIGVVAVTYLAFAIWVPYRFYTRHRRRVSRFVTGLDAEFPEQMRSYGGAATFTDAVAVGEVLRQLGVAVRSRASADNAARHHAEKTTGGLVSGCLLVFLLLLILAVVGSVAGPIIYNSIIHQTGKDSVKESSDLKGARQVANDFLGALKKEERKTAYSLLSVDYRNRLTEKEQKDRAIDTDPFWRRVGFPRTNFNNWSFTSEELRNNGAEAYFTGKLNYIFGSDNRSYRFTLQVTRGKDSDLWLVNHFVISED